MLDNNMQEAQSGIIEHTEFDIHTMKLMIEFIHTGNYTVTVDDPQLTVTQPNAKTAATTIDEDEVAVLPIDIKEFSTPLRNALITYARAFGIANYYNIESMKTMAEQTFGSLLPYGWVAEHNVDALLDVLVEVCKVTTRGDEGIRRKSIDLTTHALQHLHNDNDAAFFLDFVHHEESAVRAFVFEVLHAAAGRLRAYHRDYTALSNRHEEQTLRYEKESTTREESDARNVKAVAKLRTQKDGELAELRAEHHAEIKRLCTPKDKVITKVQVEKDAEITALRTQKDREIARLRAEKDAEVNKLAGLKDQVLATVCAGKDSEMKKVCTTKDQAFAKLSAEIDAELARRAVEKDAQIEFHKNGFDRLAEREANGILASRGEIKLARADIKGLLHFIKSLRVS
ncbi:hypothetical protein LTR95_008653 [Oleoguttula sp. CCFEE 5521]